MKYAKKTALALACLFLVLTLASCANKLDSVRRSFGDAGFDYTFLPVEDEIADTVKRELTEAGYEYELHYFTKVSSSSALSETRACALVIEFDSAATVKEIFTSSKSSTLKYLIDDYEKSDYVYGNCVLIIINDAGITDIAKTFSANK